MRGMVGAVFGVLGLLCALVGLFLINGISIEFPGIILGALGYYFCLPSGGQGGSQGGSRAGQILGIVAVVLSVVSMAVSGLTGPPQ